MKTVFALTAALLVTACVPSGDKQPTSDANGYGILFHSKTPEGVECVVYDGSRAGGVSCNWDKFNSANKSDY